MSEAHPLLVFVAGPQKGQHVLLGKPAAVLGRGSGADILLSEEYISREHIRYELLNAGPTMENLSRKGTWINGKRFKGGKKVLLETGDLIGAGDETQMLFVAAGDDPAQAVDAFGPDARERDAFGRRPARRGAEPEAEPPPEEAAGDAEGEARRKAPPKRPSEMTPGERAEAERKAKQKRILIGLGVWWAVLVVVGGLIVAFRPAGGDGTSRAEVKILSDREIRRHLREPLKPMTASTYRTQEYLDEALRLHGDFGTDVWRLHEAIHAFKKSLAYSGRLSFSKKEHQDLYFQLLNELAEQFSSRYRQACLLEKNRQWRQARDAFNELLQLLGEENNKNPVFQNVQKHLTRVKYFDAKEGKSKGGRGLFG